MYETVRVVNGYEITRMVGTRGYFKLMVSERKWCNFRTIKEAAAFAETLPKKRA